MVLCRAGLVKQPLRLLELRWLPHLCVNLSQAQGYLRRHCSHRPLRPSHLLFAKKDLLRCMMELLGACTPEV